MAAKTTTSLMALTLLFLGGFFISGCDKAEQHAAVQVPSSISYGDECHVCGMLITTFPGPKGQAFVRHRDQPLKFCSTVDLFSWLLQPETPAILQTAFVHDMGVAPTWQAPSDAHYVKATEAWYVVDHKLTGAMGHTLGSFRTKQDAELFIKKNGGRLLRFDDIDLALLANLRQPSHL